MSGFFKKSPCVNKQLTKSLKKVLGFNPKNISLYIAAFTHKSVEHSDCPQLIIENNERLEFLGDAILDAVISDLLFKRFPTANEGFLTQMRTKIVNGKSLSELSRKLNVDKLIIVKSDRDMTERIFEDAFESLIGAIYLDKGYKAVQNFISQKVLVEHINLNKLKFIDTNYKSKIIEWSQKHKIDIEFNTNSYSDDSKNFIAQLNINGVTIGEGKANSKKTAEQIASKTALENIKEGYFNLTI